MRASSRDGAQQSKRDLEDYRVSCYSFTPFRGGDSTAVATPSKSGNADQTLVVLHIDVDAFYAQVEELRDPALCNQPVGITQKYLVVTCNYPARAAGVGKLMGIQDAKKKCPGLVLISGEDLTPYREASKRLLQVLQRFGVAERLGMDEVFVDVTKEVRRRLGTGESDGLWHGHVHMVAGQEGRVASDNVHRPMDLRAENTTDIQSSSTQTPSRQATYASSMKPCLQTPAPETGSRLLLQIGSAIAREARVAVRAETGLRCSAGVAHNKLLAKLVGGLHKPDDQTSLPCTEGAAFLQDLPVRVLAGVGYKHSKVLADVGVTTIQQLRELPHARLVGALGAKTSALVAELAWGRDPREVADKGPPKTISVEDSFRSCTTFAAIETVLRVLVPDLLLRLFQDRQETGRRPSTLTVKWRQQGVGYKRSSGSVGMPQGLNFADAEDVHSHKNIQLVTKAATAVLKKHLREPFHLKLINIGVTGLHGTSGTAAAEKSALNTISTFMDGKSESDLVHIKSTFVGNCSSAVQAARAENRRRDYGGAGSDQVMSKFAERLARQSGEERADQGAVSTCSINHAAVQSNSSGCAATSDSLGTTEFVSKSSKSTDSSAPQMVAWEEWDSADGETDATNCSGDDTEFEVFDDRVCILGQNPHEWLGTSNQETRVQSQASLAPKRPFLLQDSLDVGADAKVPNIEIPSVKKRSRNDEKHDLVYAEILHGSVPKNITAYVEQSTQQKLADCNGDVVGSAFQSSLPNFSHVCEKCGAIIETQDRTLHADYHMAVELHDYERKQMQPARTEHHAKTGRTGSQQYKGGIASFFSKNASSSSRNK